MFLPLKEILLAERDRTVPGHINVSHYLGALALVLVLVETVTGVLLMIYYRPSATAAYFSTAIITDEVRLGWLMRSLHRWAGDLLILVAFLHLIRVYFSRAYRAPRQLNWAIGLALLVLTITMGFTGTLLPWDQYAYWYIDSARETIAGVPVLGNAVLVLIWGGWEIGEAVLLRFYAFHVGVLPWLAFALVCLHVLLVWRLGIAEPTLPSGVSRPAPTPFFPDFAASLLMVVLLVIGILLSAAVFFPSALFEQADPLTPLLHTQPRWYLLPVRELLRGLPGGMAALAVVVFIALLLLVPIIDRNSHPTAWQRIFHRALGLIVIAAWILMGVRGYLR